MRLIILFRADADPVLAGVKKKTHRRWLAKQFNLDLVAGAKGEQRGGWPQQHWIQRALDGDGIQSVCPGSPWIKARCFAVTRYLAAGQQRQHANDSAKGE